MRSPYGYRGEICKYFGWTYQYLLEGIGWATVQKMLIDAPVYDGEAPEQNHLESEKDIENFINSFNI